MSKNMTRRQIERKKQKTARKEAMRAQYAKWAEEGRNKGSKRSRRRGPRPVGVVSHPHGPCGNVGCRRCSFVAQPAGNTHRAWKAALDSTRRVGPGHFVTAFPSQLPMTLGLGRRAA